jgi:hypothetical protein
VSNKTNAGTVEVAMGGIVVDVAVGLRVRMRAEGDRVPGSAGPDKVV